MASEERCSVLPFADVIAELEARLARCPRRCPQSSLGFTRCSGGGCGPAPGSFSPAPSVTDHGKFI